MATKKIYKNCTQNTYKVDDGVYSSSRPSSSEIANYRLKEQTYVKVNSSNQKVKKITTIAYAKNGTGTANSVYKNASNGVIDAPSESDWNSYTDKSIIEKWTNGYLSGLLEDVIASGEITISNTADYYNGNNSEIIIYGYEFTKTSVLKTAVSAWNDDSTSATETYGDISTWNVSAITDMSNLFNGKTNITSLNLSGWDTSNVTDMTMMFKDCTSLTSLDVSNFDTSSLLDMLAMFHNCSELTSINVSNFDTSNVTRMATVFAECSNLTSLDVSNFDTSEANNMGYMFFGCSALTSLDLSNFDTSSVTRMDNMFRNCSALTSLDVSNFDTSNVRDTTEYGTPAPYYLQYMFSGCNSLSSLNISGWCVENVTEEPDNFATDAPFANTSSNLPVWGSCPSA